MKRQSSVLKTDEGESPPRVRIPVPPTYSVVPDVLLKALELVQEGKLSERGLIAVLNV